MAHLPIKVLILTVLNSAHGLQPSLEIYAFPFLSKSVKSSDTINEPLAYRTVAASRCAYFMCFVTIIVLIPPFRLRYAPPRRSVSCQQRTTPI
ncbi:hypothetical protein B0H65DRAFT_97345 [Neurospora tetraspora]|uniref:Secreted protein n=1 Tax=Neurospora tetraspora TaxID=94610 RepID=A0AAE0MUG9_9PEZI|nr:hypothetical protein B0H65DRAFT_97345 [Neurospora tetraspora]